MELLVVVDHIIESLEDKGLAHPHAVFAEDNAACNVDTGVNGSVAVKQKDDVPKARRIPHDVKLLVDDALSRALSTEPVIGLLIEEVEAGPVAVAGESRIARYGTQVGIEMVSGEMREK